MRFRKGFLGSSFLFHHKQMNGNYTGGAHLLLEAS